MADWYYAKGGKQNGPITSAQLRQLAQAGELLPDDLVFREGGTNWVAASTVNGLFPAAGGAAVKMAPQGGGGGGGFDFDAPSSREPEGRAVRPAPSGGRSNYWIDLLMFRRMIAPTIIIILFWLGVAGSLLVALLYGVFGLMMMTARDGALPGLGLIVVAFLSVPINILIVRLYCELLIVIFRINDSLMDIRDSLERQQKT